jgi:type II secretory pathway pseudopilin PulG
MKPTLQLDRRRQDEAGFMLLAVVVMAALILIALSVAAPVVARDLRRDKELESERRAEQYVRAIRLYQRSCKCTSYPPSMDALEKSTTVRFLRQRYIDPLTGKSDWRLIHQPKTTIKIPFGQELAGLAAGGLGSAAGLASGIGGTPGGSVPALGAGFAPSPGAGTASGTGGGSSSAGGSTGTSGSNSSSSSTSSSSGGGIFGDSNGGVIYGVGPSRSGNSILNPNQQTTYETWEFWYDPRIEKLYAMANLMGGGGIGSQSASSFGQSATSGQPNSGAGSTTGGTSPGGTSSFGSSPTGGSSSFGSPGSSSPGSSFPQ